MHTFGKIKSAFTARGLTIDYPFIIENVIL